MDIWIKTDKENVDWNEVADILDESQLSHYDPVTEEKIFRNSYAVAFICDGDKIVGCGRALSDGVCQAAIYNVALRPAYQGNGLGRAKSNCGFPGRTGKRLHDHSVHTSTDTCNV